jgi:hypothetical protein
LRFDGEKVTGAHKQCTWDSEKEKESIRKISMLDFDIMLSGHGKILKAKASQAVKEFISSSKL